MTNFENVQDCVGQVYRYVFQVFTSVNTHMKDTFAKTNLTLVHNTSLKK